MVVCPSIAVLANTLKLDGSTFKSKAKEAYSDLSHTRVDHDANHKVDRR